MNENELVYCGLGAFLNPLTGEMYEKTAGSDSQSLIRSEKSDVQKRYIDRHLKEYDTDCKGGRQNG